MAEALCGPSNPLQTFQKQTSLDRTLQQDRLAHKGHSQEVGIPYHKGISHILKPLCRALGLRPIMPIHSMRSSPPSTTPPYHRAPRYRCQVMTSDSTIRSTIGISDLTTLPSSHLGSLSSINCTSTTLRPSISHQRHKHSSRDMQLHLAHTPHNHAICSRSVGTPIWLIRL